MMVGKKILTEIKGTVEMDDNTRKWSPPFGFPLPLQKYLYPSVLPSKQV
jgi:hypothetical protein